MSINTTLASCNQNPALNGPDGSTDLPSTLDDAMRYALSFIAQIRDGAAYPTGMLIQTVGAATPAGGFIKANGALLSRTTYAALFAYATTEGLVSEAVWAATSCGRFSVGDGSTTFRIPDLRGLHVRTLDEARGVDSGRTIGTFQDSQNLSHVHGTTEPPHGHSYNDTGHTHSGTTDTQGDHQHVSSYPTFTGITAASGSFGNLTSGGAGTAVTSVAGAHAHNVSVGLNGTGITINANTTGLSINAAGGSETRVKTLAFPSWIKY